MVSFHCFLEWNVNKRYGIDTLIFLPSFANPKSQTLSKASSSMLVKSKFSGLRSPVMQKTY